MHFSSLTQDLRNIFCNFTMIRYFVCNTCQYFPIRNLSNLQNYNYSVILPYWKFYRIDSHCSKNKHLTLLDMFCIAQKIHFYAKIIKIEKNEISLKITTVFKVLTKIYLKMCHWIKISFLSFRNLKASSFTMDNFTLFKFLLAFLTESLIKIELKFHLFYCSAFNF